MVIFAPGNSNPYRITETVSYKFVDLPRHDAKTIMAKKKRKI